MTDAISKFTRQAGVPNSTADKASQDKVSAGRSDQSKASTSTDEVILSKAAESAMKSNDFDSTKVDEIKREIALLSDKFILNSPRLLANTKQNYHLKISYTQAN